MRDTLAKGLLTSMTWKFRLVAYATRKCNVGRHGPLVLERAGVTFCDKPQRDHVGRERANRCTAVDNELVRFLMAVAEIVDGARHGAVSVVVHTKV